MAQTVGDGGGGSSGQLMAKKRVLRIKKLKSGVLKNANSKRGQTAGPLRMAKGK